MAKVTRSLWGGAIRFEEDDTPKDLRLFNKIGRAPDMWLLQSRELYRSALRLMEDREKKWNEVTHLLQAPIALMLGAYAIETLLKMVIVDAHCQQHDLTFDDPDAMRFLPKKHDLVLLVKQAKLRVNEDDRTLLRELSTYSLWAGRYPVPLWPNGYEGPALFEIARAGVSPEAVAREHPKWPRFRALYPKLFKLAVRKTFRGEGLVLKPCP